MPEGSLLVSNEVIASRAAILAENMARWGHPGVIVTNNDPKDFGFLEGYFDVVVVDAPCSGEGMFRKDPAAIGEWSLENVATCSSRQQRILRDIAPTVRPGGILVYSTCTFAPQEDEEIVSWVLSELGAEFELAPFALEESWGWDSMTLGGVKDAAHRAWLHRVRGEGLFVCRFRRRGEIAEQGLTNMDFGSSKRQKRKNKKQGSKNEKGGKGDWKKLVAPFVVGDERLHQELADDNVFLYPQAVAAAIPLFKGRLRMLRKGILAGKLHRKGLAPAHELALSSLLSATIPRCALEKEAALRYLQKEDLSVSDVVNPTDSSVATYCNTLLQKQTANWLVPTYQGIPLGWAKLVGAKLKNQLPVNWRIRKLQ
jgi:NOL1/NOP2/fmu family ribosome biogenesis protein